MKKLLSASAVIGALSFNTLAMAQGAPPVPPAAPPEASGMPAAPDSTAPDSPAPPETPKVEMVPPPSPQPAPPPSTMAAVAPDGTKTYPPCTRTLTDGCRQRGGK